VENDNANKKSETGFSPPTSEPDAASLVAKVLHDIVIGSLRFALLGTSDGGVEIWRAAHELAQKRGIERVGSPFAQALAVSKVEALVCDAKTAREILGGIGVTSLWKMEKRGIIKRLPDFPCAMYSIEHLKKVVSKAQQKHSDREKPHRTK